MYVTSPNNMYKYSFNWRNESGELDVFEAAQYFSSAVDDQTSGNFNKASKLCQKVVIREERQHQVQRAARMSLDSIMRDEIPPQDQAKDSYRTKANKKHRQPSSPGRGKLASFLNSLFHQTRSKKRRSESMGPKNLQELEIPGERRERRSSISHFRISGADAKKVEYRPKSRNFCLSSGFRQSTPAKPGKELESRGMYEHEKRENGGNLKSNSLQNELFANKNWSDDQYTSEEREFRKFSDCDDGGDTDSSSDLFELPNCDIQFYSKGLPVFETTRRVNSIRRGAPV
ncbi:hypothetical protein F511_33943 [Dorcoceras hygrometricum]|uniref:Uncharacterized protein n=1 Tax=Dorcoceras hygrometricum TaxID=472368 RepID=A0A2Z7B2V9_9LAMI|nr:hypothetical protein F511_33943 [Dorcoceras hygrometricum]